jgi:hypothetical protein
MLRRELTLENDADGRTARVAPSREGWFFAPAKPRDYRTAA